MSKTLYEVFYIDKFANSAEASVAMANLRVRFKLDSATLKRMNSHLPVSIKRRVSLYVAEKYCQVITEAGGTAWVEEMLDGKARIQDRRTGKRRLMLDRRGSYRGSAILPDRRGSRGRRSID